MSSVQRRIGPSIEERCVRQVLEPAAVPVVDSGGWRQSDPRDSEEAERR